MELQNVLNFLADVKENNNREWFEAHRDRYEEARTIFTDFVALLLNEVGKFDPTITGLVPSDCIFRIYRDVRFSRDKKPYKTNFGASITRGGRKGPYAGYYLHLEPVRSFAGGGMWMPSGDILRAVRKEIYIHPEEFKSIIKAKAFKRRFGDLYDEKLKRPPVGFDKDVPHIDLLKYKSYVAGTKLNEDPADTEAFTKEVVQDFKIIRPFIDFLNRALD